MTRKEIDKLLANTKVYVAGKSKDYTQDILDAVAAAFGFNRPNHYLITNGKN